MYSRLHLSRLPVLAALVLAALSTSAVQAQRLEDGEVRFNDKARATRLLRVDLFAGKVIADPKDKSHQEAVEIAAKEVVYPLYWKTNTAQDLPSHGSMNLYVEQFETRLLQMTRLKVTTLQQMYCRQVIERAKDVILAGKPIAGINAARILAKIPERGQDRGIPVGDKTWVDQVTPRLAEGNAEYLAGVLLSLLDSPKTNDGVKYYVLRSLSSLLGLPKQSPPLLKKETEEKAIHLAIAMVEKKKVFPKRIDHGEVEGYKVLRREALKLVAQARVPLTGDNDRPAMTLARVAGNDSSIQPPPRLDERIEAAIGLARMCAAPKFPDFHPDYAARQIAITVEVVGLAANKNYNAKLSVRGRPWKIDAARLGEAVEAMKADVKNAYVKQVADQCLTVLRPIENGADGPANDLGDWLAKNPVPAKSLFKSGPDSMIKPSGQK